MTPMSFGPMAGKSWTFFFQHLNNYSSSINFTMECEINGTPRFLDVLISKKDYDSFSHQVFHKKNQTKQYLHVKSHHFPTQNLGVLNTLTTRVLIFSNEIHLKYEKNHLLNVFNNIGYSKHQCLKAFLKANNGLKIIKESKNRFSSVHVPFIQGTTNKIARILRKHKVPSNFRPLNTIEISLRSVKDPVYSKDMKGVYVIPCSCGTPYIGETSRSINQRVHEHATNIKHGRTWSSALAEQVGKTKHHMCIEEAKVIVRISHFHHRKFREAIEIKRRPSNLNRDDG